MFNLKKEEVEQADTTEDFQKVADLKTKECQLIEEIDSLNKKNKIKKSYSSRYCNSN